MRTNWRTEWPHWALLAAMFLGAAIAWPWVPERLPVHWNAAGEVDRYGGRFEGLLLMPTLALGLYFLLRYLPRLDPGRANYALFEGAYAVIRLATLGVLAAIYGIVLLAALGRPVDVARLAPVLAGALLVVLGGLLGKVRPTWFVGIRTPWTLSSKRSWGKTHRLGGWLFIADGLLLIAAGAARSELLSVLALAAIGSSLLALWVYSYLVWRGDDDRTPPVGSRPAEEGA